MKKTGCFADKRNRHSFYLGLLFIFIFFWAAVKNDAGLIQAAPSSTVYFDPAYETVNLNQTFDLAAKIDPGSNQVTAAVIDVVFDPSKFKLNSITPQSPPQTCDSQTVALSTVLSSAAINNDAGTASITLGVCLASPAAYITSTQIMATFNFQSKAAVDSSAISFTGATQAAAVNEEGDVIISRNPASVTVNPRTYGNADFANLVADWLKDVADSPADVNLDGTVNARDLGIMMSNWSE